MRLNGCLLATLFSGLESIFCQRTLARLRRENEIDPRRSLTVDQVRTLGVQFWILTESCLSLAGLEIWPIVSPEYLSNSSLDRNTTIMSPALSEEVRIFI